MDCAVINVKRWLMHLIWDMDDAEQREKEEHGQVMAKLLAKRYNAKKCSGRSRKSVVRMICTYFSLNGHLEKKRKIYRNRSIVRLIGSKLPLKSSKRAYFEIFRESKRQMMTKARTFVADNMNTVKSHMPQMGLADIALFSWDVFGEDHSLSRSDIVSRTSLENTCPALSQIQDMSVQDDEIIQQRSSNKDRDLEQGGSSNEKISALENELAKLRAQIALIVTTQEKPRDTVIPPTPPPPPPLLKLPPPQKSKSSSISASKKMNEAKVKKVIPDLKDVLVGLSEIKLRTSNIKRSPGGTPLKVKSNCSNSMSSDPADIIGNALRKKFAKARHSIESPTSDKENLSPHAGFSPNSPCKDSFSPITSSPRRKELRSLRSCLNDPTARKILSPVNEACI